MCLHYEHYFHVETFLRKKFHSDIVEIILTLSISVFSILSVVSIVHIADISMRLEL